MSHIDRDLLRDPDALGEIVRIQEELEADGDRRWDEGTPIAELPDDDLDGVTAGDPRTATLAREIEDVVLATTGEVSSD